MLGHPPLFHDFLYEADIRLIVVVRIYHVVEIASIVVVEIVAVLVAVHRGVAMIVVPHAKGVLLLRLFPFFSE